MASSKTIALKIALNGEREFRAAMQAAKKETGLLASELKSLETKYKDNANTMEALRAKQAKLSEAQETYTKRVKAAADGLANAKKNEEEQAKRLEELREQLDKAREALSKMEEEGDKSSDAYKEQAAAVEKLNEQVKDQVVVHAKAEEKVSDWRKELNTASTGLDEINKEIQENDKYLEEASKSADGCATSIDRYGDEVEDAAGDTEKLSVSIGDMVKNKLIDLAGDALMELGQKAVDAAKYVVEVGSSFEAQMSKVGAISGASGRDMESLTEKAREMGAQTKFSATESGEAFEYMAMAGWKTGDMLNGIEGIMNLAAASGEDLATTSDIVTDALTAFGESAEDSSRLADIMAAASSNANTNVSMMGETFKYAAPVAGALGYSMEDTAVAVGLMANAGIKASQAGTSLRSGLTRMAAPTKQAAEAMDQYGISITDSDGKMLSFRDLMVQLREKLGGLSETEQTAAANAIFGKTAMSGWLAVLNGSDEDFDKLTTAIDNSSGSAARMAETMQDNLAGKLTIMNSALESLGITIYNYVSGPLSSVVGTVTDIITGITDALTPQKTELEKFISDIEKSNDQVERSLDHAQATVESGEAKAAQIGAYKSVLEDVLDSCEEFNLVTLEDGKQAIVNSAGEVVREFEGIGTSAGSVEEILNTWAEGGFNTAGISESSDDAQDMIGYVSEKADSVESRLAKFAEDGIDTSGVETGKLALVQIFDELGTEIESFETDIKESGNVEINTGGVSEGTEVMITCFNNASGEVETFKTGIANLSEETVNLSQITTEFGKVEDSVRKTYIITDEFTKAKISSMVKTLGGSVKGLSEAWNEQTSELTASKEELEKWFDTAKEVAMYEALQDAIKELRTAWAEASVNVVKAQGAVNEGIRQFNEENGTAYETLEELHDATGILNGGYGDLSKNLRSARDELEEANTQLGEADLMLTSTSAALQPLKENLEAAMDATENSGVIAEETAEAVADFAESEEDAGDAAEEASASFKTLTEEQQAAIDKLADFYNATDSDLAGVREKLGMSNADFADWAADIMDNIEEVQKAYDDFYKTVLENNAGFLNTYTKDGETIEEQVANFTTSLYGQREEFERWVAGMKILGEMVASGDFSQELYDEFLKAGAKGNAGFIEGLAGNPEAAKEATLVYNDNVISAATATEELMKYSSAGQAQAAVMSEATVEGLNAAADRYLQAGYDTAQNVATGITNNEGAVTDAATRAVSDANAAAATEAEGAAEAGKQTAESTASGIEQTKDEVKTAVEGMISDARDAGEVIASEFHRTGQIIPQKIKQGIEEAKDSIVGSKPAVEKMMQEAVQAVENQQNSFWTSGYNSAVGVANGINSGAQNAINAAIELANAVNNAYNNTLVIQSPSKKMKKSGKHTVEGVEEGMLEEIPAAARVAEKTADKIAEAFTEGTRKIAKSGTAVSSRTRTKTPAGFIDTSPAAQSLGEEAELAKAAMRLYASRAENLLQLADEKAGLSQQYEKTAANYQQKKISATDDISSAMAALQSQAATAARYRLQDELQMELEAYESESAENLEKAIDKLAKESAKSGSSGFGTVSALTDTAISSLNSTMEKTQMAVSRIQDITGKISNTLNQIMSAINGGFEVPVPVQIGNEKINAYIAKVARKDLNKRSQAAKASSGRR